jgi:predicted RNase H-like nuclease (RuvC/YqgF family)
MKYFIAMINSFFL